MEKQSEIDYNELILEYKEKDPRVAEAIVNLKTQKERREKIKRNYIHDARTAGVIAEGFSKVDKFFLLPLEEQIKRMETIHYSAKISNNRIGYLELSGLSKEKLMKKAREINIVDFASIYAKGVDAHLKQHKIALNLKSNEYMGEPACIYIHPGAFGSVLENIFCSITDFSLKESKAKVGIELDTTDLIIRGENKHLDKGRLRKTSGESRGLGLSSIEDFVDALSGTMKLYRDKRIESGYHQCTKFGYEGSIKNYTNPKIFGIEIKIPKENLEKQRKSQAKQ